MVNHARLLGVFVPSNRRIPTAYRRTVDAVPVVKAPPFTKERRDELDSSMALNESLSDDELKALLRQRSIGLRGRRTRAHWIKGLDGPETVQDRKTYEAWKSAAESQMQVQRTPYVPPSPIYEPEKYNQHNRYLERLQNLKMRQGLMFASHYEADPERKTFLDLPLEVRNIIYSFALFGEAHSNDSMKIYYCPTRDILLSHAREYQSRPIAEETAIYILDMLGAMNKEIRRDARCLFYAHMHFRLLAAWQANMDTYTMIRHFLRRIGAEGRASISDLLDMSISGEWRLNYGSSGVADLKRTLRSYVSCPNLTRFTLDLAVSHIFTPDMEHLKVHFLHGQPLVSPNLNAFANTLASMKSLQIVHIKMRPMLIYGPPDIDTEDEAFKSLAFTGIRELVLWLALSEGVQGNDALNKNDGVVRKLGNTTIWTNFSQGRQLRDAGDESLDFEAWLEWFKEQKREGRVEEVAGEDNDEGVEEGESSIDEIVGEDWI